MNSAVRINVRVLLGNALAQFQSLIGQMRMMETAAAQAHGSIGRFGAGVESRFKAIELAGKRLGQTGRVLTYTFTLPLVLAFSSLEQVMLRVETQMSLLRQVYSSTANASNDLSVTAARNAKDIEGLEKGALALSNGFGVAKDEIIGLMVTFGRAGQEGVQLGQSTELALEIMRAYQVEAPKAADAILTVANAYQLTGRQVNVAMAELAIVSQNTRADFETVVAGIVKAAPAAQQAGIDIAHLASYLGVMQQAGFKGAEAGTALNFMLTRILKVTPESADLMHHLGLNIDEVAYAAANGVDKFDMIAHAIADLTGNQRALALATIFGARQAPKAIAMYSQMLRSGGLYDQLLNKLKDSTQALTSMENDLVTAMANPATQFQILKQQMINNFMVIAYQLTPALLVLMQLVMKVSNAFAHLDPKTQSWIILGVAILAVTGPIAILIGAFEALIGFLGHIVFAMAGAAAALASPWVLVGAALAALLVFSQRFRDAFIAVFAGLARVIMQIAMTIYAAFQWMNPFARHSPSLVERTRDGVAAMVGYWTGLKPALTIFDRAAASVTAFGKAIQKFTDAMNAANIAQQRSDIGKVAGPAAVKAYDDLIAKNKALAATLPDIEKAYNKQAVVVDKAKVALDGANAELDAAQKNMRALRSEQDKLTKQQEKLGDPTALRSQATAASNMARTLAEAGNVDLAAQFGQQAQVLNAQADAAQKNKDQLDAVANQIDAQSAAIDTLTDKRDALQATYDAEVEKLQLIKDGYDAVTQAIRDNQAAADAAAQSAAQHLAAIEAARKAAESAKGKGNDFAAFDAAGKGPALPDMTGANALAPNLPKGFDETTIDQWVAGVQKRTADRLLKIMPNPFKIVGDWFDKIKSAWGAVQNWFDGLHGPDPKNFVPHGALMPEDILPKLPPDWAKPIREGIENLKNTFSTLPQTFALLQAKFQVLKNALVDGFTEAKNRLKPTLEEVRSTLADVFGFLLDVVNDVINVVGRRLMKIFNVMYDFWRTNGKEIGTIVGVVAKFFIDWYVFLAKIALFAAKVLWPVFRMGLDGIMQVFQGVFEVIAGLLQFVVQLLTGNFTAAWEGVKKMLHGILDIIIGLGKALIAALVAFVVWLGLNFIGLAGAALARLGELAIKVGIDMAKGLGHFAVDALIAIGKFVTQDVPRMLEGLPKALGEAADSMARYFWEILTRTAGALWDFGKYIAELIAQYAPKILEDFYTFAKDIPKMIWDAIKWGFGAYIDLYKFFGEKILEWGPKIFESFTTFARKIPGKIWEGIKAAWDGAFNLATFVLQWIGQKEITLLKNFSEWAKKAPGAIWDAIKGAWDGAVNIVSYIGTWIGQKEIAIFKDFKTVFGKVPGEIWNAIKGAWDAAMVLGAHIRSWISGKAADWYAAFKNWADDIPSKIMAGIKSTWDKAVDLAGQINAALATAGNKSYEKMKSLGHDIIWGIIRGIGGAAGDLASSLVNSVKGAWDGAKSWLNSHSPSRRAAVELGAPIMQGMAIGIDRHAPLVANSMVDAARAAFDQLSAVQAAQMIMPTLVQNVRLNYLDQPLTNIGGLSSSVNGSALTVPAGAAGPQVYAPDIDVHMAPVESQDPMAMAQTLAWAMRTTVQ